MRKQFPIILTLLLITLMFNACKKDDSNQQKTCNLNATANVSDDMTIYFTATQTGDGAIQTLSYTVGTEVNTVSNPTLPWEEDIDITAGTDIAITATGTTTNGSLKVMMKGSSSSSTIESSDYCEHSSN